MMHIISRIAHDIVTLEIDAVYTVVCIPAGFIIGRMGYGHALTAEDLSGLGIITTREG